MRKIIFILLIISIFVACTTIGTTKESEPSVECYKEILNTWLGSLEDNLITKWGIPDSTYQTQNKKYLKYKEENNFIIQGNSYHFYCNTIFVIEYGMIVDWSFEGNKCKAKC